MQIKNSTSWPNWFLRRMVSWCAKQVGLPANEIRLAKFTKCQNGFRGRAWGSMRILVRVSEAEFSQEALPYKGGVCPAVADRLEALVSVTAHELFHLVQWRTARNLRSARSELGTTWASRKVLEVFRAYREQLLADWNSAPVMSRALCSPKPSIQAMRKEKALADLSRWQRKLKLAQTKVRKLKARVAYYEKL